MKNCIVLSPLKDGDGLHQAGETVSLSDKDAAELIGLGVVEAVAEPVDLTAEQRRAAIVAAIGQFDPNNADLWLRDGRPDASAIEEITGWKVPAAERNEVWSAMQV